MKAKRIISFVLVIVLSALNFSTCPAVFAEQDEFDTLRVGFFEFSGYHVIDESGRRSGYGYDFLQRLAIHGGWNYEYIGYDKSYAQSLDMLRRGEIDIITSVSKTPEREKEFLFSEQDIGYNSTIITVKANNTKVVQGDYSTYNGMTVGMLEGNSKNENFENFAKKKSFTYTPVYFSGQDELSNALQSEKVDAAVTGSLRLTENEWVLESFDASPFYVCVRKDKPELMNRINTAINEMDLHDPSWRNSMHDTYYSTDLTDSIIINTKEREFLKSLKESGKKLSVLVNPSQAPYSYFENGKAKGILPEIFEYLADQLSLSYEYITVKNDDEYYDRRSKDDVDVVLDFSGDFYLAEEEGYKITSPYFQTNFAFLSLRSFSGTAEKIAVVDCPDALYTYTTTRFSEKKIVRYNTTQECVQAVLDKKVDGATLYTYTARQYVSNDSRNRLSSYVLGGTSFAYAVRNNLEGKSCLLSLLNKGAGSITTSQSDFIVERELERNRNNKISLIDFLYTNPIYVIITIFCALLFMFAIAMIVVRTRGQKRLQKKVAEATKELEIKTQELSEALDTADTANRAKTAFLNNMSHDIRTPMNAIIGYTALAGTHLNNKDRIKDYLAKIEQSSNHLLSLINDVLDMSRIESGKITINERPENLAEILQELRNIIQSDIHAKQMELFIDTVDLTDENIYCDRLRLNQILLNLTSNAIKFTPVGGSVNICVTQKPSNNKGCAVYQFSVSDTGIGMDPEFAKTVFEPFTREQTSTVSGIQGTGLGMAITKNIVDMMDGTIQVESVPDKGTTFTVELDLKLVDKHIDLQPIQDLMGLRGLVVDDDIVCCQSTSKMLRQIGIRAEWALSGREAVARTTEAIDLGDSFEVYIVDWSMPELSGVETVRQIRRIVGDDSPIILMTAYDWSDVEQQAREAGVTGFISKPLFASELHGILEEITGHGKQEIQKTAEPVNNNNNIFTGKRILLVEDNELNQEIAKEILKESGFTVECANNGQLAFELVSHSVAGYYDLILMDVQMPVMDGYTATKAIRSLSDPALSQITIIAMTANAFEEDKQKAKQAGMNGHLAKPIDIDKMMELLRKTFTDNK